MARSSARCRFAVLGRIPTIAEAFDLVPTPPPPDNDAHAKRQDPARAALDPAYHAFGATSRACGNTDTDLRGDPHMARDVWLGAQNAGSRALDLTAFLLMGWRYARAARVLVCPCSSGATDHQEFASGPARVLLMAIPICLPPPMRGEQVLRGSGAGSRIHHREDFRLWYNPGPVR